jgi:predicted aminopeptidase
VKIIIWLAALTVSVFLSGCAAVSDGVGYYWQSATGHLSIMRQARSIDDWLADPALAEPLKKKLLLAKSVREYAWLELGLPNNGSFTKYADLKRPFVLWNVVATPELSMQMHQWCFPVAGCVTYRGYYEKAAADAFAAQLKSQGNDVNVGGVPAYSTLGYFDDPLLNTFIHYPDAELARLVFHELSHQVVYVKNDTTFNESFATAVETAGLERWQRQHTDAKGVADYQAFKSRREDFLQLLKKYKAELEAIYKEAINDEQKRVKKRELFEFLQQEYLSIKQTRWAGFAGYDRWFAQPLSNAHLAAVATYTDQVPGFLALLKDNNDDLPKFFEAVKLLAKQDKAERIIALEQLSLGRTQK